MVMADQDVARIHGVSVEQVRELRLQRGTTNDALARLSSRAVRRYLARAETLRRSGIASMPEARRRFEAEQNRVGSDPVPAAERNAALGHALDQVQTLRSASPGRIALRSRIAERSQATGATTDEGARSGPGRIAGIPVDDPFARTFSADDPAVRDSPLGPLGPHGPDWVWLGPGNVGGRTRSIVVHPTRPILWAGSVSGGVWRTTDGGRTWSAVDDFMLNLAISCMVADPNDPDTIYAGTGESGFAPYDETPRGAGLFRTTDGLTWDQIPATAGFGFINRLAVSPDSAVVFAATRDGLYRSSDPEHAQWELAQGLEGIPVGCVSVDPTDPSLVLTGSSSDGAVYRSDDGGATFVLTSVLDGAGRVELAHAAHDPRIVYASADADGGLIWRSDDGGQTFVQRETVLPEPDPDGNPVRAQYLGLQGPYASAIWCGDPTNADLVVVGGMDLWRSMDGGATLTPISLWSQPGSAHADQHTIVSHPRYDGVTNRTVWFGNDGGIFRATDLRVLGTDADGPKPYTKGWAELQNNYGVTQFYFAAGSPASGKIIGGAQDNGTVVFDPARGTEAWTSVFGGDGGWCAADPSNPKIFYGEYIFLDLFRNTIGGTGEEPEDDDSLTYISGRYWALVDGEWKIKVKAPKLLIGDAGSKDTALFIAPFLLDPNDSQRLLAGGQSLWRSNDARAHNSVTGGPHWSAIKRPEPSGSRISAIAVAARVPDTVWVGHEAGEVLRSSDASRPAPRWSRIGAGQLPSDRYVTSITVDAGDPDRVYITYGGWAADGVWATQDAGRTWTVLGSGQLPSAPMHAIVRHPHHPSALYLATDVGLFISDDRGATWWPANEGPANCPVRHLFWMAETLVCVTWGRGMFQIDLRTI